MYKPLDTRQKETRLVTILPGQFNDEIYCELHVISLCKSPVFDALSYVWGDLTSTREIFVQGISHQVTVNLEVALRYLRQVDRPRTLWIDALCINQNDIPERSSQVAQMGHIYRGAREVVAWLGEESDNSNLAFDLTEAGSKLSYWCLGLKSGTTPASAAFGSKHINALEHLTRRLWWKRVWTFQELVLAKSVQFVCGNRRMDAYLLFTLARVYFDHINTCDKCNLSQAPHQEDMSRLGEMLAPLIMLEYSRQDAGNLYIPHTVFLYRSRDCTDPRDKIYGFLGLEAVNKSSPSRSPDYSLQVSDVYAQATRDFIATEKQLTVFSQLLPRCAPHKSSISDDLPTWAPDLTAAAAPQVSIDMYTRMTNLRLYNATASGTLSIGRRADIRKLSLMGRIVGTIGSSLGEPCPADHRADANIYYAWRQFAKVDDKYEEAYAGQTHVAYGDAFWQTLCASVVPAHSRVTDYGDVVRSDPKGHRGLHDSWWHSLLPDDDTDARKNLQIDHKITANEIAQFFSCVSIATTMRRFFVEEREHGWMGLVSQDAMEGDRIAVVDGGRVPYVLRPSREEPGCWSLVGDAYVHGIMDGEGVALGERHEISLV
ncbi:heterokaryon incompatibility protein [Colletotrichum tofieldiae]|uniref:Heterokaryon incompatibility protein n=1 Tax=Colletotrichum tofieldiae TaxID=708197 RepID=A0A166TW83_9PEZI|nr:heterokaryon incompatibility protein [Colletotrichum tofieldiae]GKT54220.1 heterokaryon incompatibility protein [Colletotrichum tofieldiae]GKT73949.1 heterokaryon incompatibility protein [Colletotrichum tofieldiae]GKT95921.1 heterokaryon incompatibility protein [Colletotrichum tofieldiae]